MLKQDKLQSYYVEWREIRQKVHNMWFPCIKLESKLSHSIIIEIGSAS